MATARVDAGPVDPELVRAWVEGWVISRLASPPERTLYGFVFDVGTQPRQVTRHVLPEANEALVRELTSTITAPGTWLKTLLPREVVGPWMAPGWDFDDPGFLMSTPLAPVSAPVPDGYRMRTWTRGGLTRALVVTTDGTFAARGQVAVPPGADTAVVDQIETATDQRRKGLGSLVMRTLAHEALAVGARSAVLGATPEGQALYESLGWRTDAPLTGLIRNPSAAPKV
ncbi:GNAT family N-acetyltransferase [Streptomyces coffeae]|uniref:GNAT family N-acetyltransferase n=1 Tax=Streptomyces coffeae TaxID=621382 RepID=A0ABS1NCF4_9ACTN|nr:GNAT family N-acetyltransferase [Streptomyces coffeae]MBL1097570.1 GNAT family N-acetyltransferase [Streptomyces coffeae]